jgi:hypothetical protein
MKAITIWQPWAYCIASGMKPIENRYWSTSYRGPLAIHAGRQWDKDGAIDERVRGALSPYLTVRQRYDQDAVDAAEHPDRFMFGAIIATANLSDCHVSMDCCLPWGDLSIGFEYVWHWVLTDVRPLANPVPMRGHQRLWNVDLEAPYDRLCG